MGFDSDPATRNVFGLIAAEPELARAGIRLRQFGQEIIELLGGQKIHPAWAVPGGVRSALSPRSRTPRSATRSPRRAPPSWTRWAASSRCSPRFEKEAHIFGNFPSLFMGLVGPDGAWEHYDGNLRFVDSAGNVIADQLEARRYQEFIGEAVESHSYLKSPYYRPLGYPDGMYRVGPLARLNVCSHIGTPLADQELREFRDRANGAVDLLLPLSPRAADRNPGRRREDRARSGRSRPAVRPAARRCRHQQLEARRGERGAARHPVPPLPGGRNGLIQKVNLIIATGQNNLAMNRTVAQIARHYVRGPHIPEAMLNRVEAGIRAYDPCLSCSTHAVGAMPLQVSLVAADGTVLDEAWRS